MGHTKAVEPMKDIILTIPNDSNILAHQRLESSIIQDMEYDDKVHHKGTKSSAMTPESSHFCLQIKDAKESRNNIYVVEDDHESQSGSPTTSKVGEENQRDILAKWKTITRVAQFVAKVHSVRVEHIGSEKTLASTLDSLPSPKNQKRMSDGILYVTHNDLDREALVNMRNQAVFSTVLERADKTDLVNIRKALKTDPKDNMYDVESSFRLANRPDSRGYSPLYIACKNGNIELVKLLLEFKANPYQICEMPTRCKESIISVASRWAHLELVKFLLSEEFNWPLSELRKAYKEADNNEVKEAIKSKLSSCKKSILRICFGCLLNN